MTPVLNTFLYSVVVYIFFYAPFLCCFIFLFWSIYLGTIITFSNFLYSRYWCATSFEHAKIITLFTGPYSVFRFINDICHQRCYEVIIIWSIASISIIYFRRDFFYYFYILHTFVFTNMILSNSKCAVILSKNNDCYSPSVNSILWYKWRRNNFKNHLRLFMLDWII